jgi:hypothetical protein
METTAQYAKRVKSMPPINGYIRIHVLFICVNSYVAIVPITPAVTDIANCTTIRIDSSISVDILVYINHFFLTSLISAPYKIEPIYVYLRYIQNNEPR